MRLVFSVLLFILSSSLPARSLESANELLGGCEGFLRAYRPAGAGFRLEAPNGAVYECWGYINAFQQLSALVDDGHKPLTGACVPPEGTAVQILRVVVAYLQRHPERLHERAGLVALSAMREAFPCRR